MIWAISAFGFGGQGFKGFSPTPNIASSEVIVLFVVGGITFYEVSKIAVLYHAR